MRMDNDIFHNFTHKFIPITIIYDQLPNGTLVSSYSVTLLPQSFSFRNCNHWTFVQFTYFILTCNIIFNYINTSSISKQLHHLAFGHYPSTNFDKLSHHYIRKNIIKWDLVKFVSILGFQIYILFSNFYLYAIRYINVQKKRLGKCEKVNVKRCNYFKTEKVCYSVKYHWIYLNI